MKWCLFYFFIDRGGFSGKMVGWILLNSYHDKVNNMRDFNSGDINGDVTINDHSTEQKFKLFIHCDNDELLSEEQHRLKVLEKERKRKSTLALKILAGCGILMLFAGGWYYIHGQWDLVSSLTGFAGGLFSLATVVAQMCQRLLRKDS
jgi:hypothetical protein